MITYVKTEGIDFFGCIVLYMFICGSIQNWSRSSRNDAKKIRYFCNLFDKKASHCF